MIGRTLFRQNQNALYKYNFAFIESVLLINNKLIWEISKVLKLKKHSGKSIIPNSNSMKKIMITILSVYASPLKINPISRNGKLESNKLHNSMMKESYSLDPIDMKEELSVVHLDSYTYSIAYLDLF